MHIYERRIIRIVLTVVSAVLQSNQILEHEIVCTTRDWSRPEMHGCAQKRGEIHEIHAHDFTFVPGVHGAVRKKEGNRKNGF